MLLYKMLVLRNLFLFSWLMMCMCVFMHMHSFMVCSIFYCIWIVHHLLQLIYDSHCCPVSYITSSHPHDSSKVTVMKLLLFIIKTKDWIYTTVGFQQSVSRESVNCAVWKVLKFHPLKEWQMYCLIRNRLMLGTHAVITMSFEAPSHRCPPSQGRVHSLL